MAEESKPNFLEEENIHVELTHDNLDVISIISKVKSPKAGAIVLFAGNPPTPNRISQNLQYRILMAVLSNQAQHEIHSTLNQSSN
jgi:molybdopterin synthase catalytic subunit